MNRFVPVLFCIFLFGTMLYAGVAPAPIKALVISGMNNHDFSKTTPEIVTILENSGLFKVDVTEEPHLLTAEKLQPYQLIISNWNTYGAPKKGLDKKLLSTWSEEARNAYVDFVQKGNGHVVLHAGSSSFMNWPEYQKICLATWENGKTGHGPPHEFELRIDNADHPITNGLQPFKTFDELWHNPKMQSNVTILTSAFSSLDQKGTGNWEPSCMVGNYGKGKCVTILLGHQAAGPKKNTQQFMENKNFQTLFVRGCQWATTGEVTYAP
jgi:uncharacterized protein